MLPEDEYHHRDDEVNLGSGFRGNRGGLSDWEQGDLIRL